MKATKLFLSVLAIAATNLMHAQAGAKWATGGNSTSTGDFIGTTNNNPLIFKINNTFYSDSFLILMVLTTIY